MRQGEVAAALGEARAMVWRWHQIWSARGMAGLTAPRRSGSRVKLTAAQLAAVDAALSAGPAANGFAVATWSLERVAAVIEAVTGARCSRDTTRVVLRDRLGTPSNVGQNQPGVRAPARRRRRFDRPADH